MSDAFTAESVERLADAILSAEPSVLVHRHVHPCWDDHVARQIIGLRSSGLSWAFHRDPQRVGGADGACRTTLVSQHRTQRGVALPLRDMAQIASGSD